MQKDRQKFKLRFGALQSLAIDVPAHLCCNYFQLCFRRYGKPNHPAFVELDVKICLSILCHNFRLEIRLSTFAFGNPTDKWIRISVDLRNNDSLGSLKN